MIHDTLTITSAGGRTAAQFVPEANMVCCSLRHDGVEMLEQRRGLETYRESGKTMGIPLLYPWANRLDRFGYEAAGKRVVLDEDDPRMSRDSQGLPIHGVVPRLLRWQPRDQTDGASLQARLTWDTPELLDLFPYHHEVGLQIAVADGELTIATTVHATGTDPVPVSFGYHPYMRIPSAPRETWEVELAASRRLILDERGIPTGEREPVTERRVTLAMSGWDDAFDGLTPPAHYAATGAGTTVTVTFRTGYEFAQVFAPADQQYICFEPMTATAAALNTGDGLTIVAPGEEHRAEFTVAVDTA
jgi:aldose 1-epimerase